MNYQAANIQHIVDRYLRSEASASMILMELVQHTEGTTALARALPMLAGEPARLRELARHLADNAASCPTIFRLICQRLHSPEVARDEKEETRDAESSLTRPWRKARNRA
jgi:hypothetical protein